MAATENEYEDLADEFLGHPIASPCLECTRYCGDIVRYNLSTGEFGVLGMNGTILTYYLLDPLNKAANMNYFNTNCAR